MVIYTVTADNTMRGAFSTLEKALTFKKRLYMRDDSKVYSIQIAEVDSEELSDIIYNADINYYDIFGDNSKYQFGSVKVHSTNEANTISKEWMSVGEYGLVGLTITIPVRESERVQNEDNFEDYIMQRGQKIFEKYNSRICDMELNSKLKIESEIEFER